jgi:hypothetical protein
MNDDLFLRYLLSVQCTLSTVLGSADIKQVGNHPLVQGGICKQRLVKIK